MSNLTDLKKDTTGQISINEVTTAWKNVIGHELNKNM